MTRSGFLQNTIILASGSGFAQGISLVSLIVLQKWFYGPEDFGILGLYVSLSTLFVGCSTLKFEYGIVIPQNDDKAVSLVQLSFLSVILVTLLSVVVLLFFSSRLSDLNTQQFRLFIFLIPLTITFAGSYEILNYWNNRKGKFGMMSKSKVVQSSSMEFARMVAALTKVDYRGLIFGRVIGQATSFVYMLIPFLKDNGRTVFKLQWPYLWKTLIEYRDFALFTTPTVFISNFSHVLLIAIYFEFYGDLNAGLVSIAIQYIALPFGIISSAFSQVFFQKISVLAGRPELLSFYKRLSIRLAAAAVLMILVIYLIPDAVVDSLLGNKWSELTGYLKLSVLWQAIAFVSSSLSFIYTRLMKQKVMMLFAVIQLALVYASLTYGNNTFNDPYATFSLYVTGQCFYYAVTLVAAIYFIKTSKVLEN